MSCFRIERLIRGLLLVAVILIGGRLHGESDAHWFTEQAQVKLGPALATVEPATFAIGHAKISFTGRCAPLRQGDRLTGYFLEGTGAIEYTSANDPESPVFKQSLKEWTNLVPQKVGQGLKVGIPFSRARLLFAGVPDPSWQGSTAPGLEVAHKSFSEKWQQVDGHVPSHMQAAQVANAPDQPMVILEMEGEGVSFLYRHDPVEGFEETLDYVRPLPGSNEFLKGWSHMILLSRQPLNWDPRRGEAPVRFVLNGLDVDLRTEDNKFASMVVQESLVPRNSGLRVISFELFSEIVTKTDKRLLKVTRVADGQGNSLAFDHTHDHLVVRLATPTQAGVPLALTVEYEGDFLIRPGDDNYWQLDVRGAWYPQPRHLGEESYLFHATVRTKGEWLAFLPGDTVRREKASGWNLVETRTTQPICFATILGGKYFVEEETRDGLTVRISTYAFKAGSSNKVIKDQTFNVFTYYKNFLGAYPFKEFTIVQKNEWGYGQAPPGMMYITREAFEQVSNIRQMQEIADLVGSWGGKLDIRTMDVRHVLAHEIAHQFWGTTVKMACPEDQWLTESFADYCAALYVRDYKGKGHFQRQVARWKAGASEAKDSGPIPLANQILRKDGYEGFRMRTGLLYAKGPLLLHALHQELGDQLFLTWLKSAQTNFRWRNTSTKKMFDLLSFLTRKDHQAFYETYFWGLALPPEK